MKKYLVVGNPIEHSMSPKLHNYWIKKNNINAIYEKRKLKIDDIKFLISDIKSEKIEGANITVPFKNAVIPFLDVLSPEAKSTQSVNTIYLKDNKVIGHNTDIYGFERSISRILNLYNKKTFILGGGGVVPSIIYALKKMKVNKITLSNRTRTKVENFKKLFNDLHIIDWGKIPDFDVIINATSVGLKKGESLGVDFSKVGMNKLFYDVIYNPSKTNFLELGEKFNNKIENGKMMFIYQALESFRIWHGIRPIINEETIKLLDND